ncbi:MAG: hypothetical protein AB7F50_05655 [Fimbriimonadaceae bacterium]
MGSRCRPDDDWITYDRHYQNANQVCANGHVRFMLRGHARHDHFPDHVIRCPNADPPK